MKEYTTERLILRPTSIDDADMMLNLLNSPKFIQNIGDRGVKTREEAVRYIRERIEPQYSQYGFGNYTLIEKDTQEKIGTCGLYVRPGLEVPDIGFALFESYENQGFGYESAKYLIEKLSQEFDIEKVSAITSKTNLPSQKLIQKLGLKFKKMVVLPDEEEELLYYES